MSIGLHLLARLDSPAQDRDSLLQRIATWVGQKYPEYHPKTRLGFTSLDAYVGECTLAPALERFGTCCTAGRNGFTKSAYKLVPAMPYPWTEWAEILEHLGADKMEIDWARSHASGAATIGYRRRHVTVTLPGRRNIRLPGSFSDFEPDEGGDSFALDPLKEIWFTAYRFETPLTDEAFEAKRQEMRESRSEHFRENGSFITEAAIQKKVRKTGDPYFVLQSSNVCSTQRSVCTVVFPTAEESEWALEIWRSIQPPSVKADA